ncbi:MAG: hypothetical protein WDW38_008565 [Sanguina aurantia]
MQEMSCQSGGDAPAAVLGPSETTKMGDLMLLLAHFRQSVVTSKVPASSGLAFDKLSKWCAVPGWLAVADVLRLEELHARTRPEAQSMVHCAEQALGLLNTTAVRRLLRAAKGGHAGSLDPLATGLLPLCFGEATKLAGNLLGSRKAYVAQCRLGITTDTADLEGDVLQHRPVPVFDDATIEAALAKHRGRIIQIPPVYSAIKREGERLYVKARRGEAVEVPSREVDVFRLDLLDRSADTLTLHVECGSGTYVRSLAVDIGEDLGCGAHLISLRRLWVEPFAAPEMVTVEALQLAAAKGDEALLAWLLPVAALSS